jgi:hypothetical protein
MIFFVFFDIFFFQKMIPAGSNILVVKEPWIDLILDKKKTMEIRGKRCNKRGIIYLAKSQTKHIFGSVDIVDCKGPMTDEEFASERTKHLCDGAPPYKKTYGWCLRNPVLFDKPVPYVHPAGAIIWVTAQTDLV